MKDLIRNIRNGIIVLAVVVLMIPCTTSVQAADTVLKVGYSDAEGILADENGNHSGYAVEYLKEISKYTGWEYEYVHDSWKGCMESLVRGDVDILVMVDRTQDWEDQFLFTDLSVAHNYTVLYAAPDSDIYYQDYAALDGCRIGIVEASSSETALMDYLTTQELSCDVIRFPSVSEAQEALLRGEVDIIATSFFTRGMDLNLVDRFSPNRTYMAVGKQNQELMDQLNQAIQQIKIENPSLEGTLLKEHHNITHSLDYLYLTREEQLYLDTVGPILIKGFDGRKPLGYTGEDGSYLGILPDYLDYLGNMSGLEFIYEPAEALSFAEHAAVMEEGNYCLFYADRSLEELHAEESGLYKTDELFSTALSYIKRQGETITKYGAHTFALNKSLRYVGDLLLETNSQSDIRFFDTSQECLDAVLNGEAEMAILDEHVAAYLMQKPIYTDRLECTPGSGVYTDGICLFVPEQHRHLASILNKTLEHVSEKQRLYMVANMTLSHPHEYEVDDMLYEYGTTIALFSILLVVIMALLTILYLRANHLKRQKRETELLRQKLQRDELTGVYSREYFFEQAQAMIEQGGKELGIVRLNISHFKVINELYGAAKGDILLQDIGRHLNQLSEEYGFIAGRFTADHFYLCIERSVFVQIGFSGYANVSWMDKGVNISYGVYPVELQSGIDVRAMCDRANAAISASKENTLEYIHIYSEAIYRQLIHEQEIEGEMETALEQRQFCIYVQPKYNIETEQIVGGEALVRWKHPRKGMVPPGDFISVFEKNGFILKLDHYIWEETCRFLGERQTLGLPNVPISINVSRIHFYSDTLQETLLALLKKYHLDASYLELEITESIYSEEPENILRQCEALRKLGFRIAMDDFGSGYSSLNMLKRMPLDVIKMDLKFLSVDEDDEQARKGRDILRTQIELAHTLGLKVVVEGLETQEQRDFIRSIGGCAAQGYFYSRPVDCQTYASMLQGQF